MPFHTMYRNLYRLSSSEIASVVGVVEGAKRNKHLQTYSTGRGRLTKREKKIKNEEKWCLWWVFLSRVCAFYLNRAMFLKTETPFKSGRI